MNPLDDNMNFIDPATVSPRPTAMRYGLIWGLIGVVLALVSHVMGWGDPTNPNMVMGILMSVVSIGIAIVMLYLAIKQHRDEELGGFISFGRAFSTGFIAALISTIISVIWTLILVNFIAPDMFSGMEAAMVEQWEAQGLSDEEIEQAKGYAMMFTGPTALTVMTLIGGLVWGGILSLIMAAVMKKEAPHMA